MKPSQAIAKLIAGFSAAHKPEPGARLELKNYAHTLRLFDDFWKQNGQRIGRAVKREGTALKRVTTEALGELRSWIDRAWPEYREALELEDYGKNVLDCAGAWVSAWREWLRKLESDPLSKPIARAGVPRISGEVEPAHPEVPWGDFTGLFDEPGTHLAWPDQSGSPDEHSVAAMHVSGTSRADWVACGGGIPRQFHDALSQQARSPWTVWRALDALFTCRNNWDFSIAKHWVEATSIVVYEWVAANHPSGAVADPIRLNERRPNPVDGFDYLIPWLTDWWTHGAPISSQDAESFVLCCTALLAHLAPVERSAQETTVGDETPTLRVTVSHLNETRSKPWIIDVNGDKKRASCGPAMLLVELGENGYAESFDERHQKRLCDLHPLLERYFDRPGPRLTPRTKRDYSAMPLKGFVGISMAHRKLLSQQFLKQGRASSKRKPATLR